MFFVRRPRGGYFFALTRRQGSPPRRKRRALYYSVSARPAHAAPFRARGRRSTAVRSRSAAAQAAGRHICRLPRRGISSLFLSAKAVDYGQRAAGAGYVCPGEQLHALGEHGPLVLVGEQVPRRRGGLADSLLAQIGERPCAGALQSVKYRVYQVLALLEVELCGPAAHGLAVHAGAEGKFVAAKEFGAQHLPGETVVR